jgi:hypothetical protein
MILNHSQNQCSIPTPFEDNFLANPSSAEIILKKYSHLQSNRPKHYMDHILAIEHGEYPKDLFSDLLNPVLEGHLSKLATLLSIPYTTLMTWKKIERKPFFSSKSPNKEPL